MSPSTHSPLILIVDDDYNVARMTAAILDGAGFDTRYALSGEEARSVCAALAVAPDLLVTDVIMPVTSGPELFLDLAAKYNLKRCLFISGFPPECLGQLQDLEHRALSKPFSPAALVEVVHQILDPANANTDTLENELRRRAEVGG